MNSLLLVIAFVVSHCVGQFSFSEKTFFTDSQPSKCIGITTKGKPCQNPPIIGKSCCYHHDPSRLICAALNSKGSRCLNDPIKGSKFCNVHDPMRIKCKGTNSRGLPCQNSPIQGSDFCRYHHK